MANRVRKVLDWLQRFLAGKELWLLLGSPVAGAVTWIRAYADGLTPSARWALFVFVATCFLVAAVVLIALVRWRRAPSVRSDATKTGAGAVAVGGSMERANRMEHERDEARETLRRERAGFDETLAKEMAARAKVESRDKATAELLASGIAQHERERRSRKDAEYDLAVLRRALSDARSVLEGRPQFDSPLAQEAFGENRTLGDRVSDALGLLADAESKQTHVLQSIRANVELVQTVGRLLDPPQAAPTMSQLEEDRRLLRATTGPGSIFDRAMKVLSWSPFEASRRLTESRKDDPSPPEPSSEAPHPPKGGA